MSRAGMAVSRFQMEFLFKIACQHTAIKIQRFQSQTLPVSWAATVSPEYFVCKLRGFAAPSYFEGEWECQSALKTLCRRSGFLGRTELPPISSPPSSSNKRFVFIGNHRKSQRGNGDAGCPSVDSGGEYSCECKNPRRRCEPDSDNDLSPLLPQAIIDHREDADREDGGPT
jgi:hypothetical protein